jgi:hypothetical protein
MGGLLSVIGRSHFSLADLWADYGQFTCGTWRNTKNRTRRNAMKIVADYWRIEYLWADQNDLWADSLSLTEFINIMEKPLLKQVGVVLRPPCSA